MQTSTKALMSLEPKPGNAFDFIRFFAASGVLFSHSFLLNSMPQKPLIGRANLGEICVYVFFAVSGYLVQQSWDRSRSVRAFFQNRLLRIFPGLIVCVVLTAMVLGPVVSTLGAIDYLRSSLGYRYIASALIMAFQPQHIYIDTVFESLSYPKAVNGSIWTIRYEILMYVLLAATCAVYSKASRVFAAIAVAFAVAWVGALATSSDDPIRLLWRLIPIGLDGSLLVLAPFFLAGALIARLPTRLLSSRLALAATAAIAISSQSKYAIVPLWVLMPYCIIVFAYKAPRILHYFGKHGDFSYGIYLYAFPVQQTLVYFKIGGWFTQLVLASAITLLLAVLSWRFVESPALKLKARSAKRVTESQFSESPAAALK